MIGQVALSHAVPTIYTEESQGPETLLTSVHACGNLSKVVVSINSATLGTKRIHIQLQNQTVDARHPGAQRSYLTFAQPAVNHVVFWTKREKRVIEVLTAQLSATARHSPCILFIYSFFFFLCVCYGNCWRTERYCSLFFIFLNWRITVVPLYS